MSKRVNIAELMEESRVGFGTSGARGRVSDMTDEVCYAYTLGFLQHLESKKLLRHAGEKVAVAGDRRSSTPRIMVAVAKAIEDKGHHAINCGLIPAPALALWGIEEGIPTVMVTGSHIPDDRNGIKYNTADGEILKEDEAGITSQQVDLPELVFNTAGMIQLPFDLPPEDTRARDRYVKRYLDAFDHHSLEGTKLGLYEHSAVGRDVSYDILTGLGATVRKLGHSDTFIPVDTEAIRPQDVQLAAKWSREYELDSIISTDGDSDRPLISDENGTWLRGDIAGIICARYLGADVVVTPVSSNTAVEKSNAFKKVRRTKIGSPYVIAEMMAAVKEGGLKVVGYEANGGFLTATPLDLPGGRLAPLPTRDPLIVQLALLCSAKSKGIPISALRDELPQRFTASDRLEEFPREIAVKKIDALRRGKAAAIEREFCDFGPVADLDETDGLRITFESGDIVHLRPSGNAPELRCYTESDSEDRAVTNNEKATSILQRWR